METKYAAMFPSKTGRPATPFRMALGVLIIQKRRKLSDRAVIKEIQENLGTEILDATCSPSNIRYPQNFSLLNEAHEKLEDMVDYFHKNFHPWDKPHTYRRVARKEYLVLAKSKKRTEKKIHATIRKQLGYVRRDLEYLENYMEEGYALPPKYIGYYLTIQKLYEQQKYM